MRTKWTVLLWMLMISGLLAAQNTANTSFQVKGILLDSLTQEGEPYATIKIVKKEAPAKALKMLVTDMKASSRRKYRYGQLRDDHHFRGTYSHREGLFCEGRGEAGGLRYAVYRRCFQ